jgi:hypothetical protein
MRDEINEHNNVLVSREAGSARGNLLASGMG